MKKARMIFGVLVVLLIITAGCGNSSSSSNAPKATITISNLSPANAIFTHNSGTVTETFYFDATGYSGDVTPHFEAFDNTGQQVDNEAGNALSTAGYTPPIEISMQIPVDTSTMSAGDSGTYDLYLTDSAGGFSNKLSGTWQVN